MARHLSLRSIRPHRFTGGVGVLLLGIGLGLIAQSVRSTTSYAPPRRDVTQDTDGIRPQALPSPGSGQAMLAPSENMSDSPRAFAFATAPSLPEYQVSDLSRGVQSGETFQPLTLNNQGMVLGTVAPPSEPGLPSREKRRRAVRSQAAVWQNGSLTYLPIPSDAHRVVPGAINDAGTVAAVSVRFRHARPPYTRVILYCGKDRTIKDLGTLDPRFADSETTDTDRMRGVSDNLLCLNNRGTVAALVGLQAMVRRGSDGAVRPLGPGMVLSVNNNDVGVGYSNKVAGFAAAWTDLNAPAPQTVRPLLPVTAPTANGKDGRPLALQGSAECINDRGETVISVTVESPSGGRRIGRTAYYLHDGKNLHLIALLRGQQRSRTHINNVGELVGIGDFDLQTQTMIPLLYRDGQFYDLTNIARISGWTVVSALAINDRHQILGYGYPENIPNPFGHIVPILLTPR